MSGSERGNRSDGKSPAEAHIQDGLKQIDGHNSINRLDHLAVLAHELNELEADWKSRYSIMKANRDWLHDALSVNTAALNQAQVEIHTIRQDMAELENLIFGLVTSAAEAVKAYQQSR